MSKVLEREEKTLDEMHEELKDQTKGTRDMVEKKKKDLIPHRNVGSCTGK